MPFQVNGQAVTTKSSRLLQVAGGREAVVAAAGTALVAQTLSADTLSADASVAATSPKIINAKTPTFFILPTPEYDRSLSRTDLTCTATTIVFGQLLSAVQT